MQRNIDFKTVFFLQSERYMMCLEGAKCQGHSTMYGTVDFKHKQIDMNG